MVPPVPTMEGTIATRTTMTIRRLSIMRHPKYNSTTANFSSFSPHTLTPPHPTTNFTTTLTTKRRATLQNWSVVRTTTSFYCQKHFVTSHTFSLFECFLYSLVPCSTAVRTSSPPCACCLIFTKRRLRYLNIRHQSEHLYTVPVLFYVSKTTDDVYSNLSLSTSLGNVVEFGVPFVCWFCDDDFWGCTLSL